MRQIQALMILAALSAAVVVFVTCGERTPASAGDELPKIAQAVHNCIGWAKTKDFKLLYSVIADDSNLVEISPGGRITRGIGQFKKNEKFWGSPDFKAIRYEIRDLHINLARSGDVAWFTCMLDDINEWKGEPANWENTYWSGVLEKRAGSWVIVQQHFSFAVK